MGKYVAIFKHVKSEGAGSISRYLQNKNIPYQLVELYRGEPLPPLKSLSALVVMGGPMNVDEDEKYPYLTAEKAFIRQAVSSGLPMLGVCLGAQLLARAFFAPVTKNKVPEIGWSEVTLTQEGESDPLFAKIPATLPVVQWHGDTFAIPPKAKLLATSPLCQNQALRVFPHGYGLQFHVEVNSALLKSWSTAGDYDFSTPYKNKRYALNKIAQQLYQNFFSLI